MGSRQGAGDGCVGVLQRAGSLSGSPIPIVNEDCVFDRCGVEPESKRAPRLSIAVTVKLTVPATAKAGVVSFLGVADEDVAGQWMRGGAEPLFFWISAELAYGATVTVEAPLARGIQYFVVVNQDKDPLPGAADLVAGPVLVSPDGTTAEFDADRTFGDVL